MKRELGKMFGTFILIKTYAMEVYTSFTTMRQKNDGEYILLTEEETFSGIKFQNRAWYQNADKKILATDKLTKITKL
jgi:phosphoserine aminotransferase